MSAQSVGLVLPSEPKERQEEVEKYVAASIQMLADDLSKGASENMVKLLAFFARLHAYSAKNKLLIMLQRPDASYVASYTKWRSLGRQVAKGSKAIWVYGPVTRREQDAVTGEMAERIVGFRLLPVFDASDLTDIEDRPLPSLWAPLPDDAGRTLGAFLEKIRAEGVPVETRKLKPGVQGLASPKGIILSSAIPDSRNRLATCVHEYLHYKFHFSDRGKTLDTRQCEIEAEASAHVVLRRLGIDYPFSGEYLKSYQVTSEMLMQSLEHINTMVRHVTRLLDIEASIDCPAAA
jgi:hypothetical protein